MPVSPHSERFIVVLVAPRNPLNIGAAARAMSNFGFLQLRVVNPYEIAFREAKSAMAGSGVLATAKEYKTVADAVADCALVVGTSAVRKREINHRLLRLDRAMPAIRRQLASGRVALLFGSEKRGLSNEDLSHCNWLMHIPTRDEHVSMNLGQAVAVCLYELARTGRASAGVVGPPIATAIEVERITEQLLESLRRSGYIKPRAEVASEEKVRRLVRRLKLAKEDADLLLGMLRQILWQLREGKAE